MNIHFFTKSLVGEGHSSFVTVFPALLKETCFTEGFIGKEEDDNGRSHPLVNIVSPVTLF